MPIHHGLSHLLTTCTHLYIKVKRSTVRLSVFPLPKNATQQNLAKIQSLATQPLSQCHVSHLKSTPLNTAYVKGNTAITRTPLSISLPYLFCCRQAFLWCLFLLNTFPLHLAILPVSQMFLCYLYHTLKGKEIQKNKVKSALEASLVPLAFFPLDVMRVHLRVTPPPPPTTPI